MRIDITEHNSILVFGAGFWAGMLFLFPITLSKTSNNEKENQNFLQRRRKDVA